MADKSEAAPAIRTAKAKRREVVLLCAKCAKRQSCREKDLRRAIARAAPDGKVTIATTRCLDPCPKRMLTLATPALLATGKVILVDPALPKDAMPGVAAALALGGTA